jgi:hypothetical protein
MVERRWIKEEEEEEEEDNKRTRFPRPYKKYVKRCNYSNLI